NVPLEDRVIMWDSVETPRAEGTLDPFLVGSTSIDIGPPELIEAESSSDVELVETKTPEQIEEERAAEIVSSFYSLVEAEIVLQYRIKSQQDGSQSAGLIDFLHFGTENIGRRQNVSDRERGLRAIALGEI